VGGNLCNIDGIPAAGLNGFTCTDTHVGEVDVTEDGAQLFTATLVVGSLTDPNISNPFAACTPTSIGEVTVTPTSSNSGDFVITQTTADFAVGPDAQLPNACSVAITDSHGQQILVDIGFQVGVACANDECSGAAWVRRRVAPARLP
jgi:hypothetical protein